MKIRLANLEDLENLTSHFEKYDSQPIDYARKRLKYYIENCFIVLALDKEEIIGHLLFQTKETPFLGVGEIEGFHVLPKYLGQGIGKQLLKKCIEEAGIYFEKYGKKLRCIYLMTRSNNEAAQRLYESEGFEKKDPIGKIFEDNEPDEIMMVRFFN